MAESEVTPEQLRYHYEIERELADRLRAASREQRRTLYTSVYDELFQKVPYHSQLLRKQSAKLGALQTAFEMRNLRSLIRPEMVFLEVGPGGCDLSLEMTRHVARVVAVDVSEEITKNLEVPENFELVISDGSTIPVPAGSIDLVYSNQLMEHLHPDDARLQLQNIFTALKPGGSYFCVTPSRLTGPHDVSRHFDRVATCFHLKEYSVGELAALFREAGFTRIRVYVRFLKFVLSTPVPLVAMGEKLLEMLPFGLRKRIATVFPINRFLGVKLIGRRPDSEPLSVPPR